MAIIYEKLRLMKMFIMVLVLVVQVQQSMQLKITHPLREVVDKINLQGPYIGLGLAFPYEATPQGRKFNIGKIKGVDVIYVITGEKGVNAAIGIHTLLQSFNVRGVVWYGIAGCANTSMSIGDVGVATSLAFTSSWRWLEYGAPDTDPRVFKFGSYNLPKAGDNLLERILPEPVKILIDGKPVEERFWFSVDPHWYNLATKLQKVKLQQCVNETKCLPYVPKITFGLKGSTSDVFMSNAAYAEYLLNKHGVSIIDEESAAVVHASQTNGVPCIVFRGISDVAGKQHIDVAGISAVAATNSFKVALKFMQLIGKEVNPNALILLLLGFTLPLTNGFGRSVRDHHEIGRKFNIGKIKGVDVIYVITGEKGVNAALGVHTLLQTFNVKGVVWYGMAGCANTSMSVGDVGVPTSFSFTSSWRWLEYGAPDSDPKEFKFGAYNLPNPGDNSLERILPEPVEILINGKPVEDRFWFSVDPHWYNLATTKLQKVKLQQCVNATTCLPYVPKIAFGLKGSTSDIFMSNVGYAEHLLNKHGVSTIDEESAAVVHASQTNGVPCIVFRGISDVAGKQHINVAGISALAATNSFKVALKFIQLIGREKNYSS